jgi:Na+/melibiose symporter-like transporter
MRVDPRRSAATLSSSGGAVVQPDSALTAIRIGFTLVPAVLVALSLLALRGYRLDEADLRPSSLAAHPSAIGGPGES